MKRVIRLLGTLIVLLAPAAAQAQVTYVDVVYRDSESALPDDSGWIRKLLDGDDRRVFLVVSIFRRSRGDTRDSLLLPPRIVQSFERVDGELRRSKGTRLDLLEGQAVDDADRLLLKVEFFGVHKARSGAFAESLESLAAAYAAAGASPQASAIVISAMHAIGSVLLNNKAVYLSYSGDLQTRTSDTLTLYFDDSGNINDELFAGADPSQRLVFDVVATRNFAVDFNVSFLRQDLNEDETIAYIRLSRAANAARKRDACLALKSQLRKRFPDSIARDLVAIAINDIGWPQDETTFYCLEPNDAIRYRREHGLRNLSGCSSEECAMTKMLLILLQDDAPEASLAAVAGTDIGKLECRKSTGFSGLSRWSGVRSVFESPHYMTFRARSCLTAGGLRRSYEHEFSWLNGSLVTHKCEALSDQVCD